MAIIGKIREKSGLLVGIVGLALLAFVLGDYQSMFGNSEGKFGIGLIYGEKVNADNYYSLSSRVQQQERTQAEQEQKEFGENEMAAASNKAWEFMVDSILLKKEYEALGISVSDKEFNAYILATDGFPVLQDLAKFFTDSITGAVTEQSTITGRQKLQETITQLKTSKEAGAKQQWEGTKKYYTDRRQREKYFALLEQGVYVTKLEAQQEYQAQKETKNISFVQRLYTEISDVDAGIKVNDKELRAYFEAHKKDAKYQNLFSSREVKLFEVAIKPSKSDSANFSKVIMKLKADFLASTNDSLFVMKESENKMYFGDKRATAVPQSLEMERRKNPRVIKLMSYPDYLAPDFKKATIGEIVSWEMDEKMYVSKVIGFTPSKLKARHLLISTKESKDPKAVESKDPKFIAAKKKLADSLLMVINKDNFSDLVKKYTDDPGSKDKGGLLENFMEVEFVKEFSDFCVKKDSGQIGIVKTEYGFHIIEALGRDSSVFPLLVTIQKKSLKPSEESITSKEDEVNELRDKLEQKINKIEDLYSKIVLFDTLVRKANYMVSVIEIKDDEPNIPGLRNERSTDKILELAYGENVTVGTLISYPIKEKDRFIIAMVSAIKEKGEPLYEQVKGKMEKELIKEKKAKRLMNQMAKIKDLAVLAKQGNTSVMEAQITFSNPSLGNAGSEPEIVGSLFSVIKDGQTTLPLKGEMGVYTIKVIKTTKAPTTNTYKVERDQLLNTAKSSMQRNVVSALKKKAEVIDNRKLYNLRIRL